MTKHDFLPRSIPPLSDVKDSLLEHGPIKLPVAAKRCVKRAFPILGVFSLLIGSAFLGFSFVSVPEDHVGFVAPTDCVKNCTIKTYPAGSYLEMPWKKNTFRIVNISPRNLTLGHVDGTRFSGICQVEFKVTDLNAYLNALVTFKTDEAFNAAVFAEMKRYVTDFLNDVPVKSFTIDYSIFGLTFSKLSFI